MKKLYTLLAGMILSLATMAQCTEVFFSEYAEGSSNNKYIEIFNPTQSSVDMSNYAIVRQNGGSSSIDTFGMNGMVAAGDVYIIANPSADAAILAFADTTGSATFYNGDDALWIYNISTMTNVDIFGTPGTDPGSEWTVGTGSTKEHTLVRKSNIEGGQTDWLQGVNEWDVYAQNTWTYGGSHSSSCNATSEPTSGAPDPTAEQKDVISLFSNVYTDVTVDTWRTSWSQATLEDVKVDGNDVKKYSNLDFVGIETVGANSIDASGMEYFSFSAWTPEATTYRIKLVDFGADNAFGGGDDTEHEIAFSSPSQNTWTNHTIDLSDFSGLTSTSNISQFIFSAVPAGATTLYVDNVYFSRDPVLVYKAVDIADAIQLDADLAPTNEDSLYELTGVVYGGDLDGNAGLSFTIIDATGGMNIFNFNDVSDYVVTEGDEITARGKIDFFNGLLELFVDSIRVNSTGNALKTPTMVTTLSEATESNFIQLEKVWVADTSTVWPNNGNVWLTNEANDTFQIRIDRDIPGVAGTAILYDTMTIVGIGGQFDRSAPYDEGYQIFPRGLDDIMEWKNTADINSLNAIQLSAYPNPTSGTVQIVGSQNWDSYTIYNANGAEVRSGEVDGSVINLQGLDNGYYFIQVTSEATVGITKVILNR